MKLIYFSPRDTDSLYPLLVGHYQCPSQNSYGPHFRKYYIIHFVINGKGILYNDRGAHPVNKGEFFIIREGEQTTYVADKDEPWEYTWLGFGGSRTNIFDNIPDVNKTPAELDKKLCEYVLQSERSPDIYLSILYELIYHLFDVNDTETLDNRLRDIHRYIKYNYMDNITISALASNCGFERSYLYRIFKKKYGVSPKEYLTQVRLENGKYFLSKGYSVAECAYMVGYSDAFSFSKAYKNYYGIAPSLDKE